VEQMRVVNGACRFVEEAVSVDAAPNEAIAARPSSASGTTGLV
jgi:hypothetical protein